MTDNTNAFIVYFDDNTTQDHASMLINVIRQLPGVRDIQSQEGAELPKNSIADLPEGLHLFDSYQDDQGVLHMRHIKE